MWKIFGKFAIQTGYYFRITCKIKVMRTSVRHFHWLIFPISCGFVFVIALVLLAQVQANRVAAESIHADSPAVLYISTQGTDVGNDCQNSLSPCQTIRRAIQVAKAGDYIHVAGGTYTDSMYDPDIAMGVTATVIITKDISSLLGGYSQDFSTRDIDVNKTILSAAGSPGAHVAVLVDTNVRFGGFTITGGKGAYSPDRFKYPGGAIRIFGGSPTIRDNTIINNQAYRRGGGIYVGRNATPSILNNKIVLNKIISLKGDNNSAGGGIYVSSGPTLIRDNVITANTANAEGGGIYVGWNVPASIISNTITYNQLQDPSKAEGAGIRTTGKGVEVVIRGNHIHNNWLNGGFEGSGVYVSSPAIIDGNWIDDNYAPGGRSALCVAETTVPVTLTNNIISDNIGSGVRSFNNQDFRMINNTITGNIFRGVQVLFPDSDMAGPAMFTLRNNIVANNGECGVYIENMGNHVMDYNDVVGQRYQYCGFPSVQAHNLSQNPIFVDPLKGDYHLSPGSPAINTGDGAWAPLIDFDGAVRSQDYNVDMGAYEFVYFRVFMFMIMNEAQVGISP
jgi:parallel beta-helix repeat protein